MRRAEALIATAADARPAFSLLTCEFEFAISRADVPRARMLFARLVNSGAFVVCRAAATMARGWAAPRRRHMS